MKNAVGLEVPGINGAIPRGVPQLHQLRHSFELVGCRTLGSESRCSRFQYQPRFTQVPYIVLGDDGNRVATVRSAGLRRFSCDNRFKASRNGVRDTFNSFVISFSFQTLTRN